MEEENKTEVTQKTYSSEEKTKKCKYCQSDISMKATICPVCKKKQKPNGCLTAILVVVGIFILFGIIGNLSSDKTTETATTTKVTEKTSETTAVVKEEAPIEYSSYDVSELTNDLNDNALKAEKKYQDQYVEITGKLSTIDSDGSYISLTSSDDEFAIIGVQCYIQSDEQTDKVIEMSVGDTVTVKGQITDIGEIMGYSLDIEEIQ